MNKDVFLLSKVFPAVNINVNDSYILSKDFQYLVTRVKLIVIMTNAADLFITPIKQSTSAMITAFCIFFHLNVINLVKIVATFTPLN